MVTNMHEKYLALFREIARATSVLAERVMDYDKEKNDDKGFQTAQQMRDDYLNLVDKLQNDLPNLERADFARLLVGAIVVTQNLETEIKAREKAMQGYKIDIIPKLERVVNESEETEGAKKLAEEVFNIQEEKENE